MLTYLAEVCVPCLYQLLLSFFHVILLVQLLCYQSQETSVKRSDVFVVSFHSSVINWNSSCKPTANTKPQQTCFLLTQLALGLIIILWKCGYFCSFHIPNYFCYSDISLALMSQILYLNSVRFLFFVPSEDCSCKIHGLRVGITRASRGWTYQVHSLPVFPLFYFFSLLFASPHGCTCWEKADDGNIHVSYKNIGLVEMHLCLKSMVSLPRKEKMLSRTVYTFL